MKRSCHSPIIGFVLHLSGIKETEVNEFMVIGLAVGITVAVVAALFFFCHRKQRRQGKSADGPGGSNGIGIPSMNRDQAWISLSQT